MKKRILINKYDILLFILIISLIYGRYGLYHPASILAVLYLPFLLDELIPYIQNYLKSFVRFFFFWLIYAFLSLIWTPSGTWIFDYSLLLIHCFTFLEILVLSKKAMSPLSTLSNAWVSAFVFTSFFALWEILTDHHFASAREENMYRYNELGEKFQTIYAAFTFYNLNSYNLFITFSFPFVLYRLTRSANIKYLLLNIITLLLAIYILVTNGSRGAFLSIAIMLFFYAYYNLKESKTKSRSYLILSSFIVLALMLFFNQSLFDFILFRLEGKGIMEDNERTILINSSLEVIKQTYGFGQGVGSMLPALHNRVNSSYIYYCHNMLLEMMLEYGVLIGFFLVFFLYYLWRKALSLHNISQKIVIYGSIFAFPFYSVINSENIRPTYIWCFFASLVVFSGLTRTNRFNSFKHENIIK